MLTILHIVSIRYFRIRKKTITEPDILKINIQITKSQYIGSIFSVVGISVGSVIGFTWSVNIIICNVDRIGEVWMMMMIVRVYFIIKYLLYVFVYSLRYYVYK